MGGKQSKHMQKKAKISRDAKAFWEQLQQRASEQINQQGQEEQFQKNIHQNTSNILNFQQINNYQEEEIYYDLIDENCTQFEEKQTQTEQEQITETKKRKALQFSNYQYKFDISLSQGKKVEDPQVLEQIVENQQKQLQNQEKINPNGVEQQLDQISRISQAPQIEQQQYQVKLIQNNNQQKQTLIPKQNDKQTQGTFQSMINSQNVDLEAQTESYIPKVLPHQRQAMLIQQQKQQTFNQEILSKFLQRCFEIDLQNGKIGQINYQSIKQVKVITTEFVIKELIYIIIQDKQLLIAGKIEFLSKILNKLGKSKKHDQMVEVNEGFIDQKQYDEIVYTVIDKILKAMLNPQKLEWHIDQEDINKLENKNNFVATQIYKYFFCKNSENLIEDPFANPVLDLLLDFVEKNCKQDDALKFIELICKREVINCNKVNLSDCLNQLKAVQLLVKISYYPKLQELILENSWAYGKFELFKTGRELQQNSIFGSVMSISTFHRDFPEVVKKYYDRETSLPIQIECYRGPIYSIIHSMVDIFLKIIRRGKNSQIKLFTFLIKIIEINLNLLKVKQPEEFNKCCYQGMMFNLQQILLEIFNPFIQDFEASKKRVEKINYKLLSCIKHHPLLVRIYGKVEQVSPLKCQFIPLEQEPECDPLTFLYLLIQRINHLQHHMILDYVQTFVFFQYDKKIFGESSKFARESEAEKAAFDTLVLHPSSVKNTIQFLSFQSLVAMNLLDQNYEAKYPFGLLADTFIDDMVNYSFIYNCNDVALDYLDEITSICQFTIISLKYEKLIENIHVRVGGIQIFYILNFYISQNSSTAQKAKKLFSEDKVIKDCLIDGLIKAVIDHDKVKGHELIKSNMFLGSLTQLFAYALITHNEIYEAKLLEYFEKNAEIYKKFAYIYIGECKELFDQCLKNMLEVRHQEDQDQIQQQRTVGQKLIQALGKSILHKELYLTWKIFEESYYNVILFTKIKPQAFLIEETRQQLAQNLNEIIQELNGSQSHKYKSNFLKTNQLTPQKVMTYVIELFINLQNHEVFLQQVVQDEINFKIGDFYNIINKLQVKQIIAPSKLQEFYKIIQKLEVLRDENEQIQKIINSNQNFSQNFIDPLTGQIMQDPVQLPNSKIIVDRITIKRLLVKKQEDPFDRSLLNEGMLVEQPNLKQQITTFINEKRQQLRTQRQIMI